MTQSTENLADMVDGAKGDTNFGGRCVSGDAVRPSDEAKRYNAMEIIRINKRDVSLLIA